MYRYQKTVEKEIATIAHSCGVSRPRLLRREHARIVQPNGVSIPMDELYPEPQVAAGGYQYRPD